MEHEAELQRLREENSELKKRVNDFGTVENAKKKLETKVEQLEQKVRVLHSYREQQFDVVCLQMDTLIQDKVSQKANELTATYDEKLRNYADR
jgi:homeobox protein cut-like